MPRIKYSTWHGEFKPASRELIRATEGFLVRLNLTLKDGLTKMRSL